MDEIWKPVPGYEGYDVSNLGRVRSSRRGAPKILKAAPTSKGYPSVALATFPIHLGMRGTSRSHCVHELVLITFVGPCPLGWQARHIDGDRLNNKLDNLAWGTLGESYLDKIRLGRTGVGEKNRNSKLTEADVRMIRDTPAKEVSSAEFGRRLGLAATSIVAIRRRKSWKHLP